jgi:putative oxidoreductase
MISLGLAVIAYIFCSILLGLSLFTHLALIILIGCMSIITFLIYGSDPLGDKEHTILYLFTYLAIFLTGAGKYSIDTKVFK